jgi:hypothetical protein
MPEASTLHNLHDAAGNEVYKSRSIERMDLINWFHILISLSSGHFLSLSIYVSLPLSLLVAASSPGAYSPDTLRRGLLLRQLIAIRQAANGANGA